MTRIEAIDNMRDDMQIRDFTEDTDICINDMKLTDSNRCPARPPPTTDRNRLGMKGVKPNMFLSNMFHMDGLQ